MSVFLLFIASAGDVAVRYQQALPPGKVGVCLDKSDLPRMLKQMFLSSFNFGKL